MSARSVERLIARMTDLRSKGKQLYGQAGEIEEQLIAALQRQGGSLPRAHDRPPVRLKDNFIDGKTGLPRNFAPKTVYANRFELVLD
jgi:hypothetical protein